MLAIFVDVSFSIYDMEEAQAVGVTSIAFTMGFHTAERLSTMKPHHMVADHRELRSLLITEAP